MSKLRHAKRRVAITGIGVTTPAGTGADAYLSSLHRGTCAIRNIPDELTGHCGITVAGLVPEHQSDTCTRLLALARQAGQEALISGGNQAQRSSLGLCFASAISATAEIEANFIHKRTQPAELVRFGTTTDSLAGHFRIFGPRYTVSTGCVAGLDAAGIAFDQISTGNSSGMLVVSADATISPIVFTAFERIGAVTKRGDAPTASQPFGAERDGFVLAEGSAAILLEDWDRAKERGATPLAELAGWASVSSAYHMTSMRTDGSDLARLIQLTLKNADCRAEEVDMIDLHGTSTPINDLAESSAIRATFGERTSRMFFSAQKAHVGHSLGASNLIEVVGLSLMLRDQFLPANPAIECVDNSLGIRFERTSRRENIKTAMKISSSFSGIHSAAVLKRAE